MDIVPKRTPCHEDCAVHTHSYGLGSRVTILVVLLHLFFFAAALASPAMIFDADSF